MGQLSRECDELAMNIESLLPYARQCMSGHSVS